MTIATERLILRDWRDGDLEPLTELFADPQVMRYFDRTRSPEQTAQWLANVRAHHAQHGFGLWAVEAPEVADLIGFAGLVHVGATMPIAPAVEIAWTFHWRHWKQGYATEAAGAALADGFARLNLREVVAFTTPVNLASQNVMRRLHMIRAAELDFDHPRILAGHPLRRHVVYRAIRPASSWPRPRVSNLRPDVQAAMAAMAAAEAALAAAREEETKDEG